MNKRFYIFLAVVGIGFGPLFLGAQQKPLAVSALARAESIPNLNDRNDEALKSQLKEYHECTCKCGCYATDLEEQADRAIVFLRARAARRRTHEKLALVLDIDETTLSNYAELVSADFGNDSKDFDAWVNSAKAPAIPGTLRLYKEAERLGVNVFFLTGRQEAQRGATEENLRSQSFQSWKELILRPEAEKNWTALDYKSAARREIAARGYKIVLNVGDQWSDLGGEPEAEFSVKYPDPFYFIQ